MAKSLQIFITFASVAVFSTSSAPSQTQHKGFIRLGSFNNQQKETVEYLLSVNPTTWTTAKKDCQNIFGPPATLASIKTQEELIAFKNLTESDSTGTTYWVGGEYINNQWKWLTGEPLGSEIKWHGTGTTPPSGTKVSKVLYLKFDDEFDTKFQTVPLRYICEIRTLQTCP